MIIPIFIPRFRYDDNDDCRSNRHGYGCKCPDCLEEEWENKPKEYYKYRYAVPRSFYVKNILYRILCWSIAAIGLFIALSTIIFMSSFRDYFWLTPISIVIGAAIIISAYILGDKLIKYDFNCKDKIYLEIKDSYFDPETWEDKLKNTNIPKGYILTKEESNWRYK